MEGKLMARPDRSIPRTDSRGYAKCGFEGEEESGMERRFVVSFFLVFFKMWDFYSADECGSSRCSTADTTTDPRDG